MATVAQTLTPVEFDTALRGLAERARTRYAGEAARIERGLVIALNGGVTLHQDGSASVQSGSNAEVVYHVAHGTCDCPDFQRAPEGRCKHRFAVCLVKKAQVQVASSAGRTARRTMRRTPRRTGWYSRGRHSGCRTRPAGCSLMSGITRT
jgi:hypothetical protein